MALVLRSPPTVFQRVAGAEEAADLLPVIARALDRLVERLDVRFVGLVMHADYEESDDRKTYRRLRGLLRHPGRLTVEPGHHSLPGVVSALRRADAALTVRFHGMVFCLALGKPFVALDYTLPRGKATAAAQVVGAAGHVVAWGAVEEAGLADRLAASLDAGPASARRDFSTPRIRYLMAHDR